MKIMERNKRPLWYLLYDRKAPAVDAKGNETGEEIIVYTAQHTSPSYLAECSASAYRLSVSGA